MKEINRREFLKVFLAGGLALTGCAKVLPMIEPTLTTAEPIKEVEPTAIVDSSSQIFFNSEFNEMMLLEKWRVLKGDPKVHGAYLTLSEADIQSKEMFKDGVLQGEIYSPDWKPQSQFTDSSFGFETWSGKYNQCHYGILFKANGHLAVLRSQPDKDEKCSGDPLYQVYPPIPNWDTIRAANVVSFTLSWRAGEVVLRVSGNGKEGQTSYSGPAIPDVPLKIRFYAQAGETYSTDDIILSYAHPAVY